MLIRKWKSAIWVVLIFVACSVPSNKLSGVPLIQIPHFDKIVHFVLFFTLTILLISDYKPQQQQGTVSKRVLLWCALLSFTYSLIIEALQHFVFPTRGAELGDVMANLFGVVTALFAYKLVHYLSRGYL